MSYRRLWIAVLAFILMIEEARPQVILPPQPPVVGVPVLIPNGIGFRYRSGNGRLRIGGFFGNGTYTPAIYGTSAAIPGLVAPYYVPYLPVQAVNNYNISYNVITPNIVMVPGPTPPLTPTYDLSGVDLDVVGPEALDPRFEGQPGRVPGGARPALARQVAPQLPPQAVPQVELPANPPAQAQIPPNAAGQAGGQAAARAAAVQKAANAAVARIAAQGDAKPARPAMEVAVEDLPKIPRIQMPPPEKNPAREYDRLLDLGMASFQQGAFGLAARRFQQAADLQPAGGRAHFYLGQAYVALGNFDRAMAEIAIGLKLQPDWPQTAFRPRQEFYRGLDEDWLAHLKRLEMAQAARPNDFTLLFLLGYHKWFTGDHAGAVQLFRQARPLAPNPALLDTFLKAPQALAAL